MTRTAIFSDVHANVLALEAVLADARQQGATRFWFLGDAVGYGPRPLETLVLLRDCLNEGRDLALLGNHDAVVMNTAEETDSEDVVTLGLDSCALASDLAHREFLHVTYPEGVKWLHSLAPARWLPEEGVAMAHGQYQTTDPATPHEARPTPAIATYVRNGYDVEDQFASFAPADSPRLILNGHTHRPNLWRWQGREEVREEREDLFRPEGFLLEGLADSPACLNPGSVGCYGRYSNRPTYVLYEWLGSDRVQLFFREVAYDAQTARHDVQFFYTTREMKDDCIRGFLAQISAPR